MAYIEIIICSLSMHNTIILEWFEHLWDYEHLYLTRVVRVSDGLSSHQAPRL